MADENNNEDGESDESFPLDEADESGGCLWYRGGLMDEFDFSHLGRTCGYVFNGDSKVTDIGDFKYSSKRDPGFLYGRAVFLSEDPGKKVLSDFRTRSGIFDVDGVGSSGIFNVSSSGELEGMESVLSGEEIVRLKSSGKWDVYSFMGNDRDNEINENISFLLGEVMLKYRDLYLQQESLRKTFTLEKDFISLSEPNKSDVARAIDRSYPILSEMGVHRLLDPYEQNPNRLRGLLRSLEKSGDIGLLESSGVRGKRFSDLYFKS